METLDFFALYRLQDKVLAAVFAAETTLYLTGGTCLHRFYVDRRHSDDLDLFTNENSLFRDDVRLARDRLAAEQIGFVLQVDTRDFVRLLVEGKLQVDLVNDRVYRHGRSLRSTQGYFLDNLENICANKLCAVLGRDDPKDVFDLYTIHEQGRVDWPSAIAAAGQKCILDGEVLEHRLRSFPLELLDMLPVKNASYVTEMKRNYKQMVDELVEMV
jgi:predicted nucleotidyltransferase component of viral defense system